MKRLLLAFALLCAPLISAAQGGWMTSYDAAVAVSKKTHRPIFAFFTGSDWCGWCKKLNAEVFETPAFRQWSSQNVVLLVLDFPKKTQLSPDLKAQNSRLQGKYGITGFPTVHILTAKGDSMASQGYEAGGPERWIENVRRKVNNWMTTHTDLLDDPTKAYEGVPYTQKKLFAGVDVRGAQAPELKVEKWLSAHRPTSYAGKVVILDLWATTSKPCPEFIAQLNTWSKKYKNDVVVIGVSAESVETVQAFIKDTPMNYFVGVDTKARIVKALAITGVPHTLVISPDGIVRWQGYPLSEEDPLTDEKLATIIAAARS